MPQKQTTTKRTGQPSVTLGDAVLACVPTYERMEAVNARLLETFVTHPWSNKVGKDDVEEARRAAAEVERAAGLLANMFGQDVDYVAMMRRQWLLAQLDEIDAALGVGEEE